MGVNLKNAGIIQTILKESAYEWICGIKEKVPVYLREFIQSEYYDAYTPSSLYERQYRILEAIMTSEVRDIGNGYEFKIYLDASKVSYNPSFWSSHGVTYYRKGNDADTVFHNMARGIHGAPKFNITSGRFWERFLTEIGEGGIYDIFVGFKAYLERKCHLEIK